MNGREDGLGAICVALPVEMVSFGGVEDGSADVLVPCRAVSAPHLFKNLTVGGTRRLFARRGDFVVDVHLCTRA